MNSCNGSKPNCTLKRFWQICQALIYSLSQCLAHGSATPIYTLNLSGFYAPWLDLDGIFVELSHSFSLSFLCFAISVLQPLEYTHFRLLSDTNTWNVSLRLCHPLLFVYAPVCCRSVRMCLSVFSEYQHGCGYDLSVSQGYSVFARHLNKISADVAALRDRL